MAPKSARIASKNCEIRCGDDQKDDQKDDHEMLRFCFFVEAFKKLEQAVNQIS